MACGPAATESPPRRTATCSGARSGLGWKVAAPGPVGASRRRSPRLTTAARTTTWRWCGAPTWRSAGARSTSSGSSTRPSPAGARRRTGNAGTRRGVGASAIWLPRGSITAAPREDATVRALSRAAYGLGRSARRYDVRKGTVPFARRRAADAGRLHLARAGPSLWHRDRARRRTALGRLREALGELHRATPGHERAAR